MGDPLADAITKIGFVDDLGLCRYCGALEGAKHDPGKPCAVIVDALPHLSDPRPMSRVYVQSKVSKAQAIQKDDFEMYQTLKRALFNEVLTAIRDGADNANLLAGDVLALD